MLHDKQLLNKVPFQSTKNCAFKIARKMQKLRILRDKSIQNVIFREQNFFQNLLSKT